MTNTTHPVGTRIYFGRRNGEKTLARIFKVNRKTYGVETLEERGTNRHYPVGSRWKVPHGCCWLAEDGKPSRVTRRETVAVKSGRTDEEILRDIRRVHCALSPENLHCDGEISVSAARRKGARLRRELRALEKELGRRPTDAEIYA